MTVPLYNFARHKRQDLVEIKTHPVLILDGLFALHEMLLSCIDVGIYIDTRDKIRLERRVSRDTKERDRTYESVISQWNETVLPMHYRYIEPQKYCADIILKES